MRSRSTKVLMAAFVGLAFAGTAQAAGLKEIGQIPVKLDVPLAGFDIGWVEPATDR